MKRSGAKELERLSGDHAAAALRLLVDRGKIRVADVRNALKRRERLIREVRERLAALGVEGLHLVSEARKGGRAVLRLSRRQIRAGERKARRKLSSATRAKYRLQGAYMGFVRNLPKVAKAQVKAIREKSGVRSAITAARKMAKKK